MTRLQRLTRRSLLKMIGRKLLLNLTICVSTVIPALSQEFVSNNPSSVSAPEPQPGNISGTVVDVNGGIVPGATVVLEDPAHKEHRTVVANEDGAFDFNNLKPGSNYHVTIRADGFVSWSSPAVVVNPGEFVILSGAKLEVAAAVSSVTVHASSEEIAAEQVKIEEHQRVFGFIPNFYVVYDHNPAPLTTELKFKLALKSSTDPIVFLGAAALAGMNQAGDRPDFMQGAKGYGQRLGVAYTDSFVDIMIGGAVLPSLLHQDPRYYYQGAGTTRSRALHALASPFICKGDNGRWQPNYSSIGGDLTTGAIANAYYPSSNRGPGLVFQGALISSGGRMVNDLLQEFILRRLTPGARH
jgi:Carboxypeptidase regulatory-like domain